MKKFWKGFGVVFCAIGIIVYTSIMLAEPSLFIPLTIGDAVCGFIIFLLLRKKKPKAEPSTQPISQPRDTAITKAENIPAPRNTGRETLSELPFVIPPDVLSLLWIKNGPLRNCTTAQDDEPSAIDLTLPFDISFTEEDLTSDIGYYPSYERLTPQQRAVYLQWLSDVSKPIPIGYVFIFYYGLERFLFTDKYEAALSMIQHLRQFHSNSSFYTYSSDAMLVCCLRHNRPDLIGMIDLNKTSMDLGLCIKGYLTGGLSAQDLMDTCRIWNFTNTRYIKGQPQLFKIQLTEVLSEKYDSPILPLSHEAYMQSKKNFTIALANMSLSYGDRFSAAKDITSNPEIAQTVFVLLQAAHDRVKRILAEERKKNR